MASSKNPQVYETVYIVRAGLSEAATKKIQSRLEKMIGAQQGTITLQKDLGQKTLAYEIKKQHRGHYHQLNYTGNETVVSEVEGNLRIMEEVLRFLTVMEVPQNPETPKKEEPLREETAAAVSS